MNRRFRAARGAASSREESPPWRASGHGSGSAPAQLKTESKARCGGAEQLDDVFSHALFSEARLARTFDASEIGEAQVNGDEGLAGEPDADWKLMVEGGEAVSLDQIKALPKVEQITQFKCIEGWNYIMKWGGARFSDFAAAHGPSGAMQKPWVGLETPDGGLLRRPGPSVGDASANAARL